MAQLSFKARFIEPIQAGDKRQTLRKRTRLQAGDTVAARCQWNQPPFALLRVTRVESIERGRLTEADAQADGFTDLKELDEFLRAHYGSALSLVRISFEPVEGNGT